jgi:hypothetical protein
LSSSRIVWLKQAPRAWFERFISAITAASFSSSEHDPALFVHVSPKGRTLLLLYVDDMLIIGDNSEHISHVKQHLGKEFQMSDLGPLSYFLGMEVQQTSKGSYLSQSSIYKIFSIDLELLILGQLQHQWIFI